MSKLTVKQREKRRQLLRLLGYSSVAIAVGGVTVLGYTQLSTPATALSGETLSQKIEAAELQNFVLRLAGEGPWDAIVLGSSDCGFCRSFVADGLDAFVEEATRLSMSVGYMAISTGPGSLASSRALTCLINAGGDPVATLRATYALSAEVNAQSLPAGQVPDLILSKARELQVEDKVNVAACMEQEAGETTVARSQKVSQVFGMQATPSFYVAKQDEPTTIRLFSGFSNASATVRQLTRNRTE